MIKALRRSLIWYAFLLPTYVTFVLFVLYPVVESFRISLHQSTGGRSERWVGLDNYGRLLVDENWWNALYNTVYMGALSLVLMMSCSLIVASLVHRCRWGKSVFKVAYFLPLITSWVAAAIVFRYLLDPDRGPVNYWLTLVGLPGPLWLNSPDESKLAVVLLSLWHSLGYGMLIILAGLQAIPKELYEAGEIDGASGLQSWRYITLPNLRHTFVFLFMNGTIAAMGRFGDVWVFGGPSGSPARSLQSVVLYIYELGFGSFDFGMASAAAYVLFAITMILTLINFWVFLRGEMRTETV